MDDASHWQIQEDEFDFWYIPFHDGCSNLHDEGRFSGRPTVVEHRKARSKNLLLIILTSGFRFRFLWVSVTP